MRLSWKNQCAVALTAAGAALAAGTALAEQNEREAVVVTDPPAQAGAVKDQQARVRDWQEMRSKAVSAGSLLGGEVSNGFNPLGSVRDLVLNDDRSAVQYVLYEIPYPYTLWGADDGFVAFENVALERGASSGLDVRFDDPGSAQAPDQLRLTRREAAGRLVSRLLDAEVSFPGGEQRVVEDLLIHPETGQITHIVVNLNDDSLFNDAPRTIRADRFTIAASGEVTSKIGLQDLESEQEFDPDFL